MSESRQMRQVAVLMALVAVTHGWLIRTAVAPAPDTLRFVRVARAIRHESFLRAVRLESDHPLYPLALAGCEAALEPLSGGESPEAWALAARLVAALCAVLLVVPVYGIGRELFGPRVAWWSTLSWALMPAVNRITVEGISDGMHLLLLAAGIWAAMVGMRVRRPWWMLVAGVAAGLAFWTRPEALVLPVAAAVCLLVLRRRAEFRWPARSLSACGLCLGLPVAAAVATLAAVNGGQLSHKGSVRLALGLAPRRTQRLADQPAPVRPAEQQRGRPAGWPPLAAVQAAIMRYAVASDDVVRELVGAGHFLFPALALWALVVPWAARSRRPATWLTAAIALLFTALLVRVRATSGYLSTRHALLLVMLLSPWAGSGWTLVLDRLSRLAAAGLAKRSGGLSARLVRPAVAAAMTGAAAAACLPQMLKPLHQSRWGHRAAAAWLAQHAAPDRPVLDGHGFASFYSRLPYYDYREFHLARRDPQLAYVIVETHDLMRTDKIYPQLRALVSSLGSPVAAFPFFKGGRKPDVFVYRVEQRIARSHASQHPTVLPAGR